MPGQISPKQVTFIYKSMSMFLETELIGDGPVYGVNGVVNYPNGTFPKMLNYDTRTGKFVGYALSPTELASLGLTMNDRRIINDGLDELYQTHMNQGTITKCESI